MKDWYLFPCRWNLHVLIIMSSLFLSIGWLLLGVLLGRTARVPLP
jgi:hypothetical protein